jgi:hypothetical protein
LVLEVNAFRFSARFQGLRGMVACRADRDDTSLQPAGKLFGFGGRVAGGGSEEGRLALGWCGEHVIYRKFIVPSGRWDRIQDWREGRFQALQQYRIGSRVQALT